MDILKRLESIISELERPILFEFGMCDGYHSNLMLSILSKNKKPFIYHGFEPVYDLYKNIILKYDTSLGNVMYFNKAISSQTGIVEFYKSGGYKIENNQIKEHYCGSSSIRKPKLVIESWKDMTFEKTFVEAITFDEHINQFSLNNQIIDFIWADIQGAEVDLINGGKETFNNVRYFYTEYENLEYYEGEIGLQEICNMLSNFEIVEDYGGDVLLKNKNI
jgi:FkbM family methyltransferase